MGRVFWRVVVLSGVALALFLGRGVHRASEVEKVQVVPVRSSEESMVPDVLHGAADAGAVVERTGRSGSFGGTGLEIESAQICAYFTGTQFGPAAVIGEGSNAFALSLQFANSNWDIWCGELPSGAVVGTVLEDVEIVNTSGFRLKMIVFTYWLEDEVRHDRVRLFEKNGGESYSTWKNGIPYVWYAPYLQEDAQELYDVGIPWTFGYSWPIQSFGEFPGITRAVTTLGGHEYPAYRFTPVY